MTRFRLRLAQILIASLALFISIRLFYWQIIRHNDLQARAASQHQSYTVLTAQRGDILSSDDSILAGTQDSYLLYIYRPDLKLSNSEVKDKLLPILDQMPQEATVPADFLTPENFHKQLSDYLDGRLSIDKSWVSLKSRIPRNLMDQISALNIPGVGFQDEPLRFYPEASSSAQVLGFVGSDADGKPKGYFGLEGFYDRQLQGQSGGLRQEKDATGRPILIGNYTQYASRDGLSLRTTINRNFQYQLDSLLEQGVIKYGASSGTAILMDTKTGAILALANYPHYSPGLFYLYPTPLYRNPAVADLFEPGSVFKPLVMAAGIDQGLVKPDTQCDSTCDGPVNINSYTIKTWNDEYHPGTSMTDVIVNSDNTGMVFIANKLGAQKLHDYLDSFGLGRSTGIDLQEETTNKLRSVSALKDIDIATMSFGQGIALTAVQLISALNTIANHGNYVKPYLVSAFVDSKGTIPINHDPPRRVIKETTATQVTQMMVEAVERGEAKWAKPKEISIAGKTGTAQIPIKGHYDDTKTVASFIGFTPALDPQYTMLVSLREPTTSPWGSETAAPLWFSIIKQIVLLK